MNTAAVRAAKRRHREALKRYGSADIRVHLLQQRIEDEEDAARVTEMLRDPERAYRLMRRLQFKLGVDASPPVEGAM